MTAGRGSNPGASEEILKLSRQLEKTVIRLKELTGGGIDAVLDPANELYLLRRAHERLRQSDSLLRMAGHANKMGAWSYEKGDDRVTWSDEVCAIHEVPAGTRPSIEEAFDFYAPEWRAVIRKAINGCARDDKPFDLEAILITAKGKHVWVHAIGEVMRDTDGTSIGVQGAVQDITERKISDEQLRLSAVALRSFSAVQASILNALPAHIALIDKDGVIISVNEKWRQYAGNNGMNDPLFGVGSNYLEVCASASGPHSEDSSKVADGIRAVLRGDVSSFEFEYPCTSPKEEKWFRLLVAPMNEATSTGAVVMHIDITTQKLAENAVRTSEERFRNMFSAAATGIAVSTPLGRFLQVNEAYCRMVGYTESELLERDFVSLTHPEDIELNLRLRDEMLAGKRQGFVMEKRYLKKDGTIVWTRHSVSASRIDNGTVSTMIVIAEDITERKLAERALEQQQIELKILFDLIPAVILFKDTNARILRVNKRMADEVGRPISEIEGKLLSEIFPDTAAKRHADDLDVIRSRKPKLGILDSLLDREGKARWVHTDKVPYFDGEGRVIGIVVMSHDVTEQRRVEERYRRLVDSNVQGVFFWNTNGAVTDANDFFLRLTGYTRDDIAQGLVSWSAMTPPEFVHLDRRAIAEIEIHGACQSYEKMFFRKDGSRVPVLLGAAIFESDRNNGICFVLDLTDRNKSDEALRLSEKRFRALYEQAAVGVAQIDAITRRYLNVNMRFCEILGRTAEELLGFVASEVIDPRTFGRDVDVFRQIHFGKVREFTVEKHFQRKDASEVWASVTVSEMWSLGEAPDCYMAILQDVTTRKKLEEQFRQAQKMEAMGTLAGGIAHDFNNILASINGYTELAQLKLQGNPEVREYLGSVLRAGSRAADLVRQILSFSRSEELERTPISLRPIVLEGIKLLRATIPATIEFVTDLATDTPTVLADATQIHQVLMNLGTNAWHAMKEGGGQIEFKLERIVVDEALAATQPRLRPGTYSSISVRDTGCGMDQETTRRIFEPFFTTKPQGQGTGLGLAVVHGIMESHDGTVSVYSQPGEGTVFHLYFPAHSGEVPALATDDSQAPMGNGERILFLDDEELLVRLGKKTLTGLGYTVEVSMQPEAALALVRADPSRFALVLTDHTMPGMTGLAFAYELRRIRPSLPVVLMTGYSASLLPERIEEAGIRQVLLKPITLRALGIAVHKALHSQNPN